MTRNKYKDYVSFAVSITAKAILFFLFLFFFFFFFFCAFLHDKFPFGWSILDILGSVGIFSYPSHISTMVYFRKLKLK